MEAKHKRLEEFYNTVTTDFQRLKYETKDMKQKLNGNDVKESKLKADFYKERLILETRLKDKDRELNLERECNQLCKDNLKKMDRTLESSRSDCTTLAKQLKEVEQDKHSLTVTDTKQKNTIVALNGTLKQLNELMDDKTTELNSIKKQLEVRIL